MSFSEEFKNSIYTINENSFTDCSIAAFNYQFDTNPLYREYCLFRRVKPKNVSKLSDIPFLPIEFFKNHAVKSGEWEEEKIFLSSGTTASARSKHYIKDLNHYHQSAKEAFELKYGSLDKLKIIALLPSYVEQGDSSLISMVDYFMQFSSKGSGYYLQEDSKEILTRGDNKLVIGVSFALLDLLEDVGSVTSPNSIIMETGGMKGRRKEMIRDELHHILKQGFQAKNIHSEYGMTELQSQAYGIDGRFKFPPWARCLIRDINDPYSILTTENTGGINVIDLANIDSCCFIETKDLGRSHEDYFEVLGRFDNSDIRGCNLLI